MSEIVLIHIGKNVPLYIRDNIEQIRYSNADEKITLIANAEEIAKFSDISVNLITLEDLKMSEEHVRFRNNSQLDKNWKGGFWFSTTERFFVLQDYIESYNIEDIIHIENDVLIYGKIKDILPVLRSEYKIGYVLNDDTRIIPSILYLRKEIKEMCRFICTSNPSWNDMESLAQFRLHSEYAKTLPVLPDPYNKELISLNGNKPCDCGEYTKNFKKFGYIFDAAAIGQYLGGVDPLHGMGDKSYVNPHTVFQCTNHVITWKKGCPFLDDIPIFNLHVHNKNLKRWMSKNQN